MWPGTLLHPNIVRWEKAQSVLRVETWDSATFVRPLTIRIYIYIVNSIICLEGMPLLHQHLPDVPTYVGSTIRGSSWSEKTAWPRLVDGCRVEGTNREV